MSDIANVLAFVSVKGGVGKTTLAIETAITLVKNFNKKVLLVDANFSAPNVGLYLDLTTDYTLHDALSNSSVLLQNSIYDYNGVDVIPASLYFKGEVDIFRLKRILEKYKTRYDFIIIDSSPNYEELKPVIAAADKVFIVTSPDDVTLNTSMKAARLARLQNTPVEGLLVNRIRSPKHEYNLKQIEKACEVPVMARIYDDKIMAKSIHDKTPITILNKNHHISKEMRRFASALSGEPEAKNLLDKIFRKLSREGVNREIYRRKMYERQFE